MFFIILYKYIDSLKWVMLISGFLYYFRHEIKGVLNRPFSISRGGTTVNFPTTQQEEISSSENSKLKNITEDEIDKISHNIEKKESDIQDKDMQIFKLTLEKHFEYTYRLIFRSQIQLLQNLQTFNDGFSFVQIETYFQNVKNLFTAFEGWNIGMYLKFLYDQNFITRDDHTGKIKITSIGDLFLKYLVVSGYNFDLEKGL